jgi:Tol biopolymer transport system component
LGKQHSARQVTRGDSNDSWPHFSPNGSSIAFLSDRAKEGVADVWSLRLDGDQIGDAAPLSPKGCEKAVSKFSWSGDGKHIAYLSSDEKTAGRVARDEEKDDAMVYGQNWEFARLRIVEVATTKITTLATEDSHVYDFAWSPDSTSIAYVTQKTPEPDSPNLDGTSIQIVDINSHQISKLAKFPAHLHDICWNSEELWWRGKYNLTTTVSSLSVYKMDIATKTWGRHSFGENDCAATWALPPGLRKLSGESWQSRYNLD